MHSDVLQEAHFASLMPNDKSSCLES